MGTAARRDATPRPIWTGQTGQHTAQSAVKTERVRRQPNRHRAAAARLPPLLSPPRAERAEPGWPGTENQIHQTRGGQAKLLAFGPHGITNPASCDELGEFSECCSGV